MNIRYLELNKISESFQPELSECIQSVTRSGIYLNGINLRKFEHEFAEYTGNRHCIGIGNGYDALKVSLKALKALNGWSENDEVIVPSFTFIATALSVCNAGLKPVFCDVDENGLMSVKCLEGLVNENTRCIIPVHLYGKMCNVKSLRSFADDHNILMLEDAAQCHGAAIDGIKPGNLSTAAAFSFYPAKNLGALADGGAIVTNDDVFAETVRRIANYGSDEKYVHLQKGENSRLDEINASILSLKLRRLDSDNLRRRNIARKYSSEINNTLVKLPYDCDTEESVFHIYPIRTNDRPAFQQYMLSHGVETATHYPIPCHRQKAFSEYRNLKLPISELWAQEEVSLPISPLLSEEETDYIIKTINGYQK